MAERIITNARDIKLGPNLYQEAYKRGMSLSAFLETIDTEDYRNDAEMRGLDAFERQLRLAGIVTRSSPRSYVWADRVERFWQSEREGSAALFPEFCARVWRNAAYGTLPQPQLDGGEKRFYQSSAPISDVISPDYIQTAIRQKQIAPSIPLSLLVAITTPIDSQTYDAFYLTEDVAETQMARTPEGSPVPTARLTGADHSIRVQKYGRRLLASYESVRRMRIDRFALHLAKLAVRAEVDKVGDAIDTLISGDGNSDTAAESYDLTSMDDELQAGEKPTVKAYLNWRMQWENPYVCNVVLGQSEHILDLMLINTGSANVMLGQLMGFAGIGGLNPIDATQLAPPAYGWDSAVTDNYWLGFDNRFALELVTEVGASLTETNRLIDAQFEEIVMTESLGFAIMDANSAKTLALNA